MKKAICIFLFVLLLVPSGIYSFAEEPHTHTGELEFLRTEEGLEIPCCGVYRCSECGETFEESISPADVGMPIIQIEGSLDGISKEKKVTVHVNYNDGQIEIASPATLKWQGASSLLYPKKNYNIQFLKENGSKNKVELTSAWGEQSKYCLKANWVDFSGLRNVVSAKLFGEIVHSRCKDDPLDKLVNGGAIDGFPVLLYHDGDFQGLYTLNTPKDKWIFDMTGKSEREGLLFGENWSDSVMIKTQIPDVNDPSLDGWEVEYCSTEDDPDVGISWLGEGMNRLISFVTDHNGENFKAGINTLTDIDRCIDYMLYIFFIGACDNVGKNILWTTYDGNIYIPSAYDLDTSWGLFWTQDFPDLNLSSTWGSFSPLRQNLLFTRILDNYSEEITARYLDLRESVLSYGNIARQFHGLADRIPACVYEAESTKWPTEPNQDTNNLAQILQYTKDRIDCLDKLFQVTVEEKTEKAWRAEFACEDGAKVLVYPSQDYSVPPVRAAEAFSVDSETGELTKSGGQINFKVMAPADATVQIEILPATAYNKLKTPSDTGEENTYRITKISGDLTVHIRLIEEIPEPEGWNITFDCDPEVKV